MNSIPVELRQAMYVRAIDIYKSDQAVIIQKYVRRWRINKLKYSNNILDILWANKFENALDSYSMQIFEFENPQYTVYKADRFGGRIVNIESNQFRNQQNILLKFDASGEFLNCIDLCNNAVIDGYMLFLNEIDNVDNFDNTLKLLIFDDLNELAEFKHSLEYPKLKEKGYLDMIKLLDESEFFEYSDTL